MSNFDQLFAAVGVPLLQEEFADTGAVYIDVDKSETAVSLIPGEEEIREISGEGGRTYQRVREVTLFASEVARPSMKGRLRIAGEEWSIEEILAVTAHASFLRIVRPERTEVSRPGYRRET